MSNICWSAVSLRLYPTVRIWISCLSFMYLKPLCPSRFALLTRTSAWTITRSSTWLETVRLTSSSWPLTAAMWVRYTTSFFVISEILKVQDSNNPSSVCEASGCSDCSVSKKFFLLFKSVWCQKRADICHIAIWGPPALQSLRLQPAANRNKVGLIG